MALIKMTTCQWICFDSYFVSTLFGGFRWFFFGLPLLLLLLLSIQKIINTNRKLAWQWMALCFSVSCVFRYLLRCSHFYSFDFPFAPSQMWRYSWWFVCGVKIYRGTTGHESHFIKTNKSHSSRNGNENVSTFVLFSFALCIWTSSHLSKIKQKVATITLEITHAFFVFEKKKK